MNSSFYKILQEVVQEVINEVRLIKISITLFSASNYSSHGKERTELDTVNITPIMSVDNLKIEEIFSESEIEHLNLWFYSEYKTYICAEGILTYRYIDSSDYDGKSISWGVDIDTKRDDDWNLIKERIKPILEQSDVNDAIKKIGDLKRITEDPKDDKTEKQILYDIGAVRKDNLYDKYSRFFILTFNNGKMGLFLGDLKKYRAVIPPTFEWVVQKGENIEAIKGDDVFTFSVNKGVAKIIKKGKISDTFNKNIDSLIKTYKRDNVAVTSAEDKLEIGKFFIDIIDNYLRGPEQDYWKSHYEEAVELITLNLKIYNHGKKNNNKRI